MRLYLVNLIEIEELTLKINEERKKKKNTTQLQNKINELNKFVPSNLEIFSTLQEKKHSLWKLKHLLGNILYPKTTKPEAEMRKIQKPHHWQLGHLELNDAKQFENETKKLTNTTQLQTAKQQIQDAWSEFMKHPKLLNKRLFPYEQLQAFTEQIPSIKAKRSVHIDDVGKTYDDVGKTYDDVGKTYDDVDKTNSLARSLSVSSKTSWPKVSLSKVVYPNTQGGNPIPKKTQNKKTLAFYQNIAKSRGISWRGLQKAALITAIKDA